MDDNRLDRKSNTPAPRLSSTSYVYPVKSLLEGRIRPHPLAKSNASRSSDSIATFFDAPRELESPTVDLLGRLSQDVEDQGHKSPTFSKISSNDKGSRKRAASTSSVPSNSSREDRLDDTPTSTKRNKSKSKSKSPKNFSHFPAGHNPYFAHTFSSALRDPMKSGVIATSSSSSTPLDNLSSDMSVEHVLGHPSEPSNYPRRLSSGSQALSAMPGSTFPSDISTPLQYRWNESPLIDAPVTRTSVDADIGMQPSQSFEEGIPNQKLLPDSLATPVALYPGQSYVGQEADQVEEEAVGSELLPFNPSEYGIVHLPPLPFSGPTSERGSSTTSSSVRNSNMNRFLAATSNRSFSSSTAEFSQGGSPRPGPGPSSSVKSKKESSASDEKGSGGGTNSMTSDDPYFSVRFRSMQDENGNHVVVGREGELLRCEDEVGPVNFYFTGFSWMLFCSL